LADTPELCATFVAASEPSGRSGLTPADSTGVTCVWLDSTAAELAAPAEAAPDTAGFAPGTGDSDRPDFVVAAGFVDSPGVAGRSLCSTRWAADPGAAGRGIAGLETGFAEDAVFDGRSFAATPGWSVDPLAAAPEPPPRVAGCVAVEALSSARRDAAGAGSALFGWFLAGPPRPASARVRPVAAHPGDVEPPNRAFRGVLSAERAAFAGGTSSVPSVDPAATVSPADARRSVTFGAAVSDEPADARASAAFDVIVSDEPADARGSVPFGVIVSDEPAAAFTPGTSGVDAAARTAAAPAAVAPMAAALAAVA
jgi:hypothetical protein